MSFWVITCAAFINIKCPLYLTKVVTCFIFKYFYPNFSQPEFYAVLVSPQKLLSMKFYFNQNIPWRAGVNWITSVTKPSHLDLKGTHAPFPSDNPYNCSICARCCLTSVTEENRFFHHVMARTEVNYSYAVTTPDRFLDRVSW